MNTPQQRWQTIRNVIRTEGHLPTTRALAKAVGTSHNTVWRDLNQHRQEVQDLLEDLTDRPTWWASSAEAGLLAAG